MISDYIDEVLQEDEGLIKAPRRDGDDGGITFTAKSPRRYFAWNNVCAAPLFTFEYKRPLQIPRGHYGFIVFTT